jgi:cyanophycinase
LGVPEVKSGSLVIVGGGGLPDEIARRFVELGGGAKGLFVVLPTAMPDPLPANSGDGFLRRLGVENIVVLKAREQQELERPETLDVLSKATAIWFGGGRQWHFVDAYEGTKIGELFHDVLRRGGVIGGSSAGATIQGDYLVRGAPAGPHIMMCEGYERALGFLPGVAIDQHFSQRKRFGDMTALMQAYPQFLGIGIDEATALIVQGHVAEVLGKGSVHFYDRRKPLVTDRPDYESVPAGKRYDLKERSVVPANDSQ